MTFNWTLSLITISSIFLMECWTHHSFQRYATLLDSPVEQPGSDSLPLSL